MFALDFLCIGFPHFVLLGVDMSLIGTPTIRIKPRDAQRLQQLLESREDLILVSSEHLDQDRACMMINGVPQPARMRFATHVTPHFFEFGHDGVGTDVQDAGSIANPTGLHRHVDDLLLHRR